MNIEELKEEKLLLENNIRSLVNSFINKTDLPIYSVNIDMIDCSLVGKRIPNYMVDKVRVMVNL